MDEHLAAAALEELRRHYRRVAVEKFADHLPLDFRIAFNAHLRRLTGRITYARRLIEISSFHFARYGLPDALATLEHELLHLYLHSHGRPSGHNEEFKRLAAELGIRVYHANAYPRNQPSPFRWIYKCPDCERMVFRRRQMAARLACGICCRSLAGGRWTARFELVLVDRVRMV